MHSDRTLARELEEKLKNAKNQDILEYMQALEDVDFDQDNKFKVSECVICLENFEPDAALKMIPTCEHFFH